MGGLRLCRFKLREVKQRSGIHRLQATRARISSSTRTISVTLADRNKASSPCWLMSVNGDSYSRARVHLVFKVGVNGVFLALFVNL